LLNEEVINRYKQRIRTKVVVHPTFKMSHFQPMDDVQSLRQQIASAQARLQQYTDISMDYIPSSLESALTRFPLYYIVISQANELRILRDNICQNCKARFTPAPESSAGTPSSSSSSALMHPHSSPEAREPTNRKSFWRRILSQPIPTKRLDLSLPQSSIPPSNLSYAHPPALIAKSSTIEHHPLPQTPKTVTVIPVPATETPIQGATRPEWSVEYEKPESRAVNVTFVCAFAREANIMSVNFSRDGKYLAASVAGYSGKISIYGVESAKETWSALVLHRTSYIIN
jgi:hypothetical protein